MHTDDPNRHAAHCPMCDAPMSSAGLCRDCDEALDMDDDDIAAVDAHLEAAYEERFEFDDDQQ